MADFPDDLSDIDLVMDDESLLDAQDRSFVADGMEQYESESRRILAFVDDYGIDETKSDDYGIDESKSDDEAGIDDEEDELVPVEPIPWLGEPEIEFAIDMISDNNQQLSTRLRMRRLIRLLTQPDLLDHEEKERFYGLIETNLEGFSIDDVQMDAVFPIIFLFAPVDRILESMEFVTSVRMDYMFVCVTNWLKGLMIRVPDMSDEIRSRLADRLQYLYKPDRDATSVVDQYDIFTFVDFILTMDEYDRYESAYAPLINIMYGTMATVPEKLSIVLESVRHGHFSKLVRGIGQTIRELMDFFDKEDTTPFLVGFRQARSETNQGHEARARALADFFNDPDQAYQAKEYELSFFDRYGGTNKIVYKYLFQQILLPAGLIEYVIQKNRSLAWELVDIFLSNDPALISDELIACLSFASMIRLEDAEITKRWLRIQPVEERAVFYMMYSSHEQFLEFARAFPQAIVAKLRELVVQAVGAGRVEAFAFLRESYQVDLTPKEMLDICLKSANDAPEMIEYLLDNTDIKRADIVEGIKTLLSVPRQAVEMHYFKGAKVGALLKAVPWRSAMEGYSIDRFDPLVVLADLIGLDVIMQRLPCSRLAPLVEYAISQMDDDSIVVFVVEIVRAITIKVQDGLESPLTQLSNVLFVFSPFAQQLWARFQGRADLFVNVVEMIYDSDLLSPPDLLLIQVLSENPDMNVYWDMLFAAVDMRYSDGKSVLGKSWAQMEPILVNAVRMILIANQTPTVFKILSLETIGDAAKERIRAEMFTYASENFSLQFPDKVARELAQANRRGEVSDATVSTLLATARARNNLVFVREMLMLDIGRDPGVLDESVRFAIESGDLGFVQTVVEAGIPVSEGQMLDALRSGNKELIAYLLKHGAPITRAVQEELGVLRDDSLSKLVASRARSLPVRDLTSGSERAQAEAIQGVVPDWVDLGPVAVETRAPRAPLQNRVYRTLADFVGLYTEEGILPDDNLTPRMLESLVLQARSNVELARTVRVFVPGESAGPVECPSCFEPRVLLQMECCDVAKCAKCWRDGFQVNLNERELARCGDCHKVATEGAIRQVEPTLGAFDDLVATLRSELSRSIECPRCRGTRVLAGRKVLVCQNAECQAMTCLDCKDDAHPPFSCTSWKKVKRRLSEFALTPTMSQCPVCKYVQEKESGCNSIECGRSAHTHGKGGGCLYNYCFVCKQAWSGHTNPYLCSRGPPPEDAMKQFWEVVKSTNASILSKALVENIERLGAADAAGSAALLKELRRAFDAQSHIQTVLSAFWFNVHDYSQGRMKTAVEQGMIEQIEAYMTRLRVLWFSRVQSWSSETFEGVQAHLAALLPLFRGEMEHVIMRLDAAYLDPDCLVAYTALLRENPSLKGNIMEIRANMSENCDTFVDEQVQDEGCKEQVTRHTRAIVDRNMSKRQWLEYLRSVRVDAGCEKVSKEMYDKIAGSLCSAHVQSKTKGKSNEEVVALGRSAFFDRVDPRCVGDVESAWGDIKRQALLEIEQRLFQTKRIDDLLTSQLAWSIEFPDELRDDANQRYAFLMNQKQRIQNVSERFGLERVRAHPEEFLEKLPQEARSLGAKWIREQ